MSRVTLSVFLVAVAIGVASGQLERCHTTLLTPHHFLNLAKFTGVWYTQKVGPSKPQYITPLRQACHNATITSTEKGTVLIIEERYLDLGSNGTSVPTPREDFATAIIGEVNPVTPIPAIWSTYYNEKYEDPAELVHGEAVIISSNEESWAVQYLCNAVKNSTTGEVVERIAILSREPELNPTILKTLDTFIYGLGFRLEYLQDIRQTNC